jgi:hypothetical protein
LIALAFLVIDHLSKIIGFTSDMGDFGRFPSDPKAINAISASILIDIFIREGFKIDLSHDLQGGKTDFHPTYSDPVGIFGSSSHEER